ncbi:MAG: hypothetical protein AB4042_05960 [Leptolyngbyaceae cyanobacterium]
MKCCWRDRPLCEEAVAFSLSAISTGCQWLGVKWLGAPMVGVRSSLLAKWSLIQQRCASGVAPEIQETINRDRSKYDGLGGQFGRTVWEEFE